MAVLLCLSVAIAGYFYYQYQSSIAVKDTEEIVSLIKKIGSFMELPGGEPTLATVTDKEKLADQPFFQKAENGDKVLIYADAGRAILYRPSTKKFGEANEMKDGEELHILNNCGIVYKPENPYILCILTEGKDYGDMENAIQRIVKSSYTALK